MYVGRIDAPAAMPGTPLLTSESEAVWVPDPSNVRFGDLLTINEQRIEVRRFDAERLAFIGDPKALDLRAGEQTPYQPSMFSASQTTLAFVGDSVPFGQRLRRSPNSEDRSFRVRSTGWVRLSPYGQRPPGSAFSEDQKTRLWVDDLDPARRSNYIDAAPRIYPVGLRTATD